MTGRARQMLAVAHEVWPELTWQHSPVQLGVVSVFGWLAGPDDLRLRLCCGKPERFSRFDEGHRPGFTARLWHKGVELWEYHPRSYRRCLSQLRTQGMSLSRLLIAMIGKDSHA